jgi:hypothetical protein
MLMLWLNNSNLQKKLNLSLELTPGFKSKYKLLNTLQSPTRKEPNAGSALHHSSTLSIGLNGKKEPNSGA